jgi:hypothetical protein
MEVEPVLRPAARKDESRLVLASLGEEPAWKNQQSVLAKRVWAVLLLMRTRPAWKDDSESVRQLTMAGVSRTLQVVRMEQLQGSRSGTEPIG